MIINWVRGYFELSCASAVLLMNKKNAVVIDIRNQNEYSLGYIINSINIPFENIKKNNVFSHAKLKDNPLIIVHDNYGRSAYSIKQYLNRLGFLEVYVLKGGIYSWKNYGLPLLFKK